MDLRRLATLCLCLALLPACAGDIDFSAIEPECESPQRDSPGRDLFCSVTAGAHSHITLPEGQVAMGAHARSGLLAVVALEDHQFVRGEDNNEFWVGRPAVVYQLDAAGVPNLESIDDENTKRTEIPLEVGTAPFSTRVLAERGGVIGMGLLNDLYFVTSQTGKVHRNLSGLRYPGGATLFEKRGETLALDVDAWEHGDELLVASAVTVSGLKVQRFAWDEGGWAEVLPDDIKLPAGFRDGGPLEARGYELSCLGRSPTPQATDAEWRSECVERCPDCRLAGNVSDACQRCRLNDTFVLPVGVASYSVATLADPAVVFTGGTDLYAYPTSVVDPLNWGELEYEDNGTFGASGAVQIKGYLGATIALRNYTLTGESSVSRVALAMAATSTRLYVVAGDTGDDATTTGLDMLVFEHNDGALEPDILALFKLPDTVKVSLFVSVEAQDNGLVTVRSIPLQSRGFGPAGFVSYDMIDVQAPLEIANVAMENDENYGTHGLAALPGHLVVPDATGLSVHINQASGALLP